MNEYAFSRKALNREWLSLLLCHNRSETVRIRAVFKWGTEPGGTRSAAQAGTGRTINKNDSTVLPRRSGA